MSVKVDQDVGRFKWHSLGDHWRSVREWGWGGGGPRLPPQHSAAPVATEQQTSSATTKRHPDNDEKGPRMCKWTP